MMLEKIQSCPVLGDLLDLYLNHICVVFQLPDQQSSPRSLDLSLLALQYNMMQMKASKDLGVFDFNNALQGMNQSGRSQALFL